VAFDHGITVTIERPGGQTRHGDRLPPVTHEISGCAAYPRSTSEDNAIRDQVEDVWVLLAPYGADITETDVVVLPGGFRYEVDGAPGGFSSPFTGWQPGTQIVLRRVVG
jgi:hypothetical protein